jgi:hypothetical protein
MPQNKNQENIFNTITCVECVGGNLRNRKKKENADKINFVFVRYSSDICHRPSLVVVLSLSVGRTIKC